MFDQFGEERVRSPGFPAWPNASGNVVYVPTGTYRIDGTVTLGPNTHLVMEGGTLLRTNHTCARREKGSTDFKAFLKAVLAFW